MSHEYRPMREEQDISAADCPTRPELEDLIAGRLAFDQHAALERHIESCAAGLAFQDAAADDTGRHGIAAVWTRQGLD